MTIAFRRVKGPYGWLSNMSPHPVNGFRTAEAMFQAYRFPSYGKVYNAILTEKSPMGAKMVAKKHANYMIVVPRSEADLRTMRMVLELKVNEHPELLKALLATGDELIVEDVSARPNESGLFWGAALQPDGTWHGNNQLGKMWMELRTRWREEYL